LQKTDRNRDRQNQIDKNFEEQYPPGQPLSPRALKEDVGQEAVEHNDN
jgi:hypothetical protein